MQAFSKPAQEPLFTNGQEFGHFRLVRFLGRGGMGEVYEAEDLESGRRIALKILTGSLESLDKKRFLREGRLAARVSHPNSVYVFGTEEVEGTVIIAMELVPGGTLQEKVEREGPLPVAQAVKAVLQIIDGLAAAEMQGVLHRDIKPSNCFIHPDGTVKVGDFGLSKSSSSDETQLTVGASVLGTPAFASPEQIQGRDLDVRSDIFSVGSTLYFLLTGQPPFQAEGAVQLIAAVLKESPPSPAQIRSEVSNDLAKVILKCLEKSPQSRYSTYADLKDALEPFQAQDLPPGNLSTRFFAGIIDYWIIVVFFTMVSWIILGHELRIRPDIDDVVYESAATGLLAFAYFVVAETMWGTTLGKAIFSLRLATLQGGYPGWQGTILRNAVYVPVIFLGALLNGLLFLSESRWNLLGVALPQLLLAALLFVTARRTRGLRGLHELASGTRIVQMQEKGVPRMKEGEVRTRPPVAWKHEIGPYLVSKKPEAHGVGILDGYDLDLRRPVWIVTSPPDVDPVSTLRRDTSRAGRLRWLDGRRGEDMAWDAYEAMPGRSLRSLLRERQPWGTVRLWLADLAEELDASRDDDSVSFPIGIDQIWIGLDSGAKILDFEVPPSESLSSDDLPTLETSGVQGVQGYLWRIAIRALEGPGVDLNHLSPDEAPRLPLPMPARAFLTDLAAGRLESLGELAASARTLAGSPATITPRKRLGQLFMFALVPLMMSLFFGAFFLYVFTTGQDNRDKVIISFCLNELQRLSAQTASQPKDVKKRKALENYLAGRFSGLLADPAFWDSALVEAFLPREGRTLAEELLEMKLEPSAADLEGAEKEIQGLIGLWTEPKKALRGLFTTSMIFFGLMSVVALITTPLFGGGLLFHLLGIGLVTKTGARASRWRALLRSLIVSSPFLVLFVGDWLGPGLPAWLLVTLMVIWLVGGLWTIARPNLSPQDWLAGTRLVVPY